MSRVMKRDTRMMPTKGLNKKQGGFTLIEIAIVLVIIGLLLGGVLKGQELINTARVRALNNSVDGITAAWFSFQDRYRAFPGDYTQANTNILATLTNGDGNGRVITPAERGQLWAHLEAAGYVTGGYDGVAMADGAEYICPVATCPDNGFGAGMNLAFGNQIRGGAAAVDSHELITGRGIPVEVIAELDRKVDDGEPETGAMQLGLGGTGWIAADSTACQRDNAGTSVYQLQTPSSNCAAVFRNF